ncbi:MAG: helix-turn-helix transcriptional regulator [Treponema sp.]|nr:helix-turn-helix transcriptional regulator [Candidatus Treponema caballi]
MFNEQIRELRQNAGINQAELARALGVTKQSVSNWENDNIMPSVEMLIKIAGYFNVTTDYLLGLSSTHVLLTDGLTEPQISHLQLLIKDLTEK